MYYLYEGYWSNKTFIFYILIIALSFFIPLFSRKKLRINKNRTIDIALTIVFLMLLAVLGFRTTGRDINGGYYLNFLTATSINAYRDQSVEIGFVLLNVIVKRLFNNYTLFILIIAMATLVPIFWFIKKNVPRKNIPYALLLYVSAYYFSGFSAARQYLSVSICLIAYDRLKEKKHTKALLWILLAASIHSSALFMFIPFFVSVNKIMSRKMIWISIAIMFVAVYLLRGSILGMLGARYSVYSSFNSVQIGTRWIAYYIPILLLLYRELKNEKDKYLSRLNVTVIALGFLFEMLGYVVSILGRMFAITIPFIFIIPYYIDLESSAKNRKLFRMMMIVYCGLRFWLYINDHYINEGLMPYRNLFFSLN